jgi:FKBP-type peptidyl-prolyl cis-trans isomerase (trigger factor)
VLTDESGQSEAFAVTGVYRVVLPTPDETARHYGHSSWDAFAAAVREELHRVAEARRKTAWRLAALDAAADALQVEVPPSLLAESVEDEMRELRLDPGQKPQLEGAVRRKLRREIVAQRLAEAKGLRPDEDEVRRRTEGHDRDETAVRASLLLEQAADWIIAHARRNG